MAPLQYRLFEPQLIPTGAAAIYIGMSEYWLKASRFRVELDGPKYAKIGRAVRYDIRDLEAWIEERKLRGSYQTVGGAS